MMCRSLLVVCLTAAVCAAQAAPAPPEGPRRIRLAPQSTAKEVGAFRYRLLPDPRDRTPGNAAPLWRLASDAFRDAKHKMTNVDQYDRVWDDVCKALTVPTWQALPLMEAEFRKFRSTDNILLTLLLPALNKTWLASVRFERQLAGLRCAEALRLYAAAHQGKAPAKWGDITEVPLPIDPHTGKGFDIFYQMTDGRGLLEIPPPPPPGMPASLGRRYELAPRP
jgi:hypothetical protein